MNNGILKKLRLKAVNPGMMIALVIAILFSALVQDTFFLHIAILIFMYTGVASSWNIISGYGGQMSLGHAAYFGIGGYTTAILYTKLGVSPWIGLLAGGLLSSLIAVMVGYPSLRLRGAFYSLVTIAFMQVMQIVAVNWSSLTDGSMGLHIRFEPAFGNMMFEGRSAYAFIFLGFAVIAVSVSYLVNRSKLGYSLIAIRENLEAAEALGVNSPKIKTQALFISSFLTGVGGALYAFYVLIIDPYDIFSMHIAMMIAVVCIVGGMGTVAGPIIGSVIIVPLNELLRAYVRGGNLAGLNLVIYGLVLIVMALRYPEGLYYGLKKLAAIIRSRRKEPRT